MAGYRKFAVPRIIARKPVPKAGIYMKYGKIATMHVWHCCPRCGQALNAGPDYQPRHCSHCGQKISFSGIVWPGDRELGAQRRGWDEPVQD